MSVADFATYDGVLQIGLPPRRIDLLNRVAGVSFDEAVADGRHSTSKGAVYRSSGDERSWRTSALLGARRTWPTWRLSSGDSEKVSGGRSARKDASALGMNHRELRRALR